MLSGGISGRSFWLTIVLVAGLTLVYLAAAAVLLASPSVSPDGRLWLELILGAGFAAAVIALCIRWWRGVDEAQREAWKWAWYWGSTFGLAVPIPVFVLLSADQARLLSALLTGLGGPTDVRLAFVAGILVTLVPMLAGAAIAWVVWWGRRR